ncbi:MAG: ABC transporter ATP-binding protein [Steroidobacteraceae bacterium]
MDEAAISIADLRFAWAGHAPLIAIERLEVRRGERVFLQGASGSGKSTLLALVGGVLRAQRGSLHVLGTELGALSASKRDRFRGDHVGFIFQMFNLIPYLTVRANVLLPLRFSRSRSECIARLGEAAANREALRLLAAVGLADAALLDRSVLELSVGQQQRVAAARALIGRPELVIADEPTSALDADSRADFLELLMTECRAFGTTLLFVSHDAALGARFDRVIAMTDLNAPAVAAAAA